ncbi:hypothetical protein [Oscillatoria sp. FACHB-1406]|uniref:hypothetical protein n=1 Tax=Oscillatoria sp. FACHB-1406 TaxID=2692846 RepID=UPI001683E170|nr:hypothetical protein [Oscillatoria sp. FACHB-1406]MBD2579859.1 hypothetical protein [Oscillatoria sp. FACHB-1406]
MTIGIETVKAKKKLLVGAALSIAFWVGIRTEEAKIFWWALPTLQIWILERSYKRHCPPYESTCQLSIVHYQLSIINNGFRPCDGERQ